MTGPSASFLDPALRRGGAELPVVEVLDDLTSAIAREGALVLVAPPGAGKTTLVPLALLDGEWRGKGRILVLEPRRMAARAAADRMAFLLGEQGPGGTVGYRVRMDTRVGSETRVEVVTEGVLTRMVQSDPTLEGIAAILFDEFHERSLHADLGLALVLQARSLFRPDLRIAAMSATLEAAPVAELLGQAPVVRSEGRAFPVDTRSRDRPVEGWIEPAVAGAVLRALDEEEGDVLAFLPGAAEIRRTAERLAAGPASRSPSSARMGDLRTVAHHPDTDLFPLFGRLSREAQDRAVAPSPPGRRKVVLATSIAETSLTIEGVRVVVDSGLMRVPRFDPGTGMTRLETLRVTRDAADQRRGRAGRTAPGVCYRLWTAAEDRGLVPRRRPEILEADLAPLALELAVWGASPEELRWLDPPPLAAWARAVELLEELEAVETVETVEPGDGGDDGNGGDVCSATPHGRRIAGMGLHPRLAHLLVRGREMGLGALACDTAAILGDRDFLRAEGRAPDPDLRLRVEALRAARQIEGGGHRRRRGPPGVPGHHIDRAALRRCLRESRHWRRSAGVSARDEWEDEDLDTLGLLCALAYPDRIGQRRTDGGGRFLLRNGRGARVVETGPLSRAEWLVAVDVDAKGREGRIFRAAPVRPEDLEERFVDRIEEVEEVVWDPDGAIVRPRRRRMLGALILSESPLEEPDPTTVRRVLLEGVREGGLQVLPWDRETEQLRERLHFLHTLEPETWPDASLGILERQMETWLEPFLAGMRRLDDLARLDLNAALLGRVGWEGRQRLDTLAPTHVEVPSGSRIRIDYSDPGSPALAVRLQEVFGLTETPRIAGGRVPLTMELLSPAHRPVQVTRDLASFWRDAYFEVRKDLRGRYPKHPWPEDPLGAEPTRRTKQHGRSSS